ncbi:MAG: hypothetical protein WED11_08350, partial [Natronospirillum sp.]
STGQDSCRWTGQVNCRSIPGVRQEGVMVYKNRVVAGSREKDEEPVEASALGAIDDVTVYIKQYSLARCRWAL